MSCYDYSQQEIVHLLKKMGHSRVHNYVIPGLTSALVGGEGKGTVRLFEQSRAHEEPICPHSHRFDFGAVVIQGYVQQTLWHSSNPCHESDFYSADLLVKNKDVQFGSYTRQHDVRRMHFRKRTERYDVGQMYFMKHTEIHSINFSKDAVVLFLEGPEVVNESVILQPIVNGKVVPTFKVEDWMFEHE